MIERKKQSPAKSNNKRLSFLLKFARQMIDSLIAGLELADAETRKRIMQLCGEACAREEFFGPALEVAKG
jgi:hypothetical protein